MIILLRDQTENNMHFFIIMIMAIAAQSELTIKSTAFESNGYIPSKYTCDGEGINPPLSINEVPQNTKCLALIVDDPDAPNGTFDHWVMWNIPVRDTIAENSVPGAQGKNGIQENKYIGPCPPSGIHHYHFKVYALDTRFDLPISTDKNALIKAIDGHVLAKGELVGLYNRHKKNKMQVHEIIVPVDSHLRLRGNLVIPNNPVAFVVFSHSSGSNRFSVRNNFVAALLHKEHIATLLTDQLTDEEDEVFENRFNIELLTERLIAVTMHASQLPGLENLPVGYFGASTGAAPALKAAATLVDMVKAVVSRGGRPDLAGALLVQVKAPTLLIVGSLDKDVIKLNTKAYSMMRSQKDMEIIDGASHLFEEPGKLNVVGVLAAGWFREHLQGVPKLTSA